MQLADLRQIVPPLEEFSNRPSISSQSHFWHIRDRLRTRPIPGVEAVVAVRPGLYRRNRLPVTTVARFRFPYSVIERMARVLAPVAASDGVVPLITPIRSAAFTAMAIDDPWAITLRDTGVLLYVLAHRDETT